jgi:hypothetical protein
MSVSIPYTLHYQWCEESGPVTARQPGDVAKVPKNRKEIENDRWKQEQVLCGDWYEAGGLK